MRNFFKPIGIFQNLPIKIFSKMFVRSFKQTKKFYSTDLKHAVAKKIPLKQAEAKEIRAKHGNFVLTKSTVEQVSLLSLFNKFRHLQV